jgi:Ion channel
LMAAHASEIIVWALAYRIVDALPSGDSFVYFAFVNYTTLGYGDITPVKAWQLLGPAAAMNGILLFGWSTAVIFEVLRKSMTIVSPSAT